MDIDDIMPDDMPDDVITGDILPDGLPKILPPYENGVFQAVLMLPEAHAALVGTVAAVLDRPVKTVTLRNNSAPSRDKLAKQEEYDINCVVDGEKGDQCNVEIQASPMEGDNKETDHRNIKWRSVFNLCDLHSNQPGRGLAYGEFVRSYQVMFCKYKVFSFDNDLVERFIFRNQKGNELCDAVMSIFIDLTKAKKIAKKPVGEMTDIEAWAVFYALGADPDYCQILDEMTKLKEGIAVARDTLSTISQSADERARYRSRRIAEQDKEHVQAILNKRISEEIRAEYESLLASMAADIARMATDIARMAADIAHKDAEIASKDAEIACMADDVKYLRESMTAEIASSDDEIKSLRETMTAEIARRDDEIRSLHETMTTEIANMAAEMAEFRDKLNEGQQFQ